MPGHKPLGWIACWPAFDYDGKPAQTDGSYSRTIVTGSQRETAHYTAESRTMTAADGRMQIRLDGKNYKSFPAEEYAVVLTNLSKTEPTGIVGDFRSLKLSVDKPDSANAVTVNVLRGSTCKATDFVPEVVHDRSRKRAGSDDDLRAVVERLCSVPRTESRRQERLSVCGRLDGIVEGAVCEYRQGG